MSGNYFFKTNFTLVVVATVVLAFLFYKRCLCFRQNAAKSQSAVLFQQTTDEIRAGGSKRNYAGAEIEREPLEYKSFLHDVCLRNIPIPNITLDTTYTPEQEKAVLTQIFNETGGTKWKRKTHWGDPSVSHCLWYGISCNHGYVISIYLSANNLIGTFPGKLWMLRNLMGLCIGGNNELLGHPSDILSSNMTRLLRLEVSFNKLSGQIPGEVLVQMKSLVKIQLCCQTGQERLSGKIPKDIGNLTDLQVLSLGENMLYGSIPKSIGQLRKLWFLDLESTRNLHSGFENLLQLSSLRYMLLSHAGLNGALPEKFGFYFPAMISCMLQGNHFTGTIPATIGNMTKLKYLSLQGNDFTGQIPKDIGSIRTLRIVDFGGNRLSSVEKGIRFKFRSLAVLILAENKQLTMRLDTLLQTIEPLSESLSILNISGCHFYGPIPYKLWNFHQLISLDFSRNQLSGQIPSPTAQMMYYLVAFDVSVNNLSGHIPQISITSLKILNVSKNQHMHETNKHGTLPNFLKVDFTTLTHRGPSDKFKCPNLRLSYNDGLVVLDPSYYRYRLCICDRGYYGSEKTCLPCMSGAVCKDKILPAQNMLMKVGYWPSARNRNVTHLVKCSQLLGVSPYVKTACNPSGSCACSLMKRSNLNSRPFTICNESCLCLTGSKDRFCSLCEDGYFKVGTLCYACSRTKTNVYILAALAVLSSVLLVLGFLVLYERKRCLSMALVVAQITLLAFLVMYQKISGWFVELNTVVLVVGLTGKGKATRGILKTSVFYFQTFDVLISNTEVWPREVLKTQRYISNVFNLHFSGLACEIPPLFTPLGELLFLIFLPIICLAGIWLFYGLEYTLLWRLKLLDRQPRLRDSCLQLTIVCLNLTYFPIVKKTASVLARCGEDNNFLYLLEAPWLECQGHVYVTLQVFGWLALVLYVVGVPFGVFLPLVAIKVAKREHLTSHEKERLDGWLGSLYLPYKKEFRSYFEILFLVRRMLIAFSLSFIPRASIFQTLSVSFVLLASLCFQLRFKPFRDSFKKIALENSAETMVLLILHFSFINIKYAVLNRNFSSSIIWMLVALNGFVLGSLILSIIVLLGRSHSPDDEQHDSNHALSLLPGIDGAPQEQYGTFND